MLYLVCLLFSSFSLLNQTESFVWRYYLFIYVCVCVSDSHFFSNLESEKYNVSNGLFSLFKSSKTIWNIEEKKDQIFSVRNTHMAAMKYIQIIKIRIENDCAKTHCYSVIVSVRLSTERLFHITPDLEETE